MSCIDDLGFTAAELAILRGAFITLITAPAVLAAAYVTRLVNRWRRWEQ